jgi:hypothetical protein
MAMPLTFQEIYKELHERLKELEDKVYSIELQMAHSSGESDNKIKSRVEWKYMVAICIPTILQIVGMIISLTKGR